MPLISIVTLHCKVEIGKTLVQMGRRGQFIKARKRSLALGIVTAKTKNGMYVITYH